MRAKRESDTAYRGRSLARLVGNWAILHEPKTRSAEEHRLELVWPGR